MIDTQNMPYCIPITIVRDGDAIYFHCAQEGQKVDTLRRNPNVCLSCVGDTNRARDKFTTYFESAVVRGTASEVVSDEEKIHALRLLCERHTPTNMSNFDAAIERSLFRTAIWKIQINSMTGKCKKAH
jgi:hypothetical protein